MIDETIAPSRQAQRAGLIARVWAIEFVRYLAAGGINTIATYIAYLWLLPLMHHQAAYALTYVLGIFTSYALNARLVFHQPLRWRGALQFPLVFIVQYGLAALFLELFVAFGMSAGLAGLVNIAPTVPITFLLSRWIIKPRNNQSAQVNQRSGAGYRHTEQNSEL